MPPQAAGCHLLFGSHREGVELREPVRGCALSTLIIRMCYHTTCMGIVYLNFYIPSTYIRSPTCSKGLLYVVAHHSSHQCSIQTILYISTYVCMYVHLLCTYVHKYTVLISYVILAQATYVHTYVRMYSTSSVLLKCLHTSGPDWKIHTCTLHSSSHHMQ